MKDNAFQRRRDIERMLLSGKKLTTSEMMKMYGVGRKAIRRDFDIIGEELPVITKQGYDGGYLLADGLNLTHNYNIYFDKQVMSKEPLSPDK
ncbi:hypothetical protein C823_000491 [Eubacterium plexicaudatum ASF492]|nr:hypothetical protein C823_000491 [Eubacterium plexicaudatum ASF492]